jgi:ketosteroid isomerase-like protein
MLSRFRLKLLLSDWCANLADMSNPMHKLLRLLPFLALACAPLLAAPDPVLDAVRQADDARVAATIAADHAKLSAIFSDDLNYAHSGGMVNDKAAYIDTIVSGHTKYFSIDYVKRKFTLGAPGIVLMIGNCFIKSANDGKPLNLHLNFLAVWRLEGGAWRLLAWQSCRLPAEMH